MKISIPHEAGTVKKKLENMQKVLLAETGFLCYNDHNNLFDTRYLLWKPTKSAI